MVGRVFSIVRVVSVVRVVSIVGVVSVVGAVGGSLGGSVVGWSVWLEKSVRLGDQDG